MSTTLTLTGKSALEARYLIALARIKYPEFYTLTDSEILETLIAKVTSREATA